MNAVVPTESCGVSRAREQRLRTGKRMRIGMRRTNGGTLVKMRLRLNLRAHLCAQRNKMRSVCECIVHRGFTIRQGPRRKVKHNVWPFKFTTFTPRRHATFVQAAQPRTPIINTYSGSLLVPWLFRESEEKVVSVQTTLLRPTLNQLQWNEVRPEQ